MAKWQKPQKVRYLSGFFYCHFFATFAVFATFFSQLQKFFEKFFGRSKKVAKNGNKIDKNRGGLKTSYQFFERQKMTKKRLKI